MPNAPLLNTVLSLLLIVIVGWLLVIGKNLFLPIFTAVISVYILNSSTAALGRQPLIGRLPNWALSLLVLSAFTLAVLGVVLVVSVTVDQLLTVAPAYQENLRVLLEHASKYFGFRTHPTWEDIRAAIEERVHIQDLLRVLLASLTSFGGSIFLVVVYAGFLLSESGTFERKLAAAFADDRARQTSALINHINAQIGDYLAVKSLINVILGAICYLILWAMDVDFALFWAVMIGLLNYIPYVGSLMGVAFPVVLSLAQFGSVPTTLLLAVLLTGAQASVGNILEPRMIGRQLNLSPFIVLVALSLWATLWGIPGAILAIPLTSMITIICAAFPSTRFIAILLAERIGDDSGEPDGRIAE